MMSVNVLVVSSQDLDKSFIEDIGAIDPRVTVKDGRKAFAAEIIKTKRQGLPEDRLLKQAGLNRDGKLPELQEDLDSLLTQADVVFGTSRLPYNMLSRAPRLNWIHVASAGLDAVPTDIFGGRATVTNSRGAVASPMAEQALSFMCMLAKNAPRLLDNKKNKRWERFVTIELRYKTVGIIALGAVGCEVTRLAKGIGMKVIATEKAAIRRGSNMWGVDEIYPSQDLHEVLAESDFVVVASPLTKETMAMIGEKELRAMKPTAYLINISRGKILDQSALIRALKEGWIAGAGLDVVETEPLPADSELWGLPNVILSSHMAGSVETRSGRILGLFCQNLKSYLAGQQLRNIVDGALGF